MASDSVGSVGRALRPQPRLEPTAGTEEDSIMTDRINGKVVVITGASSGIGKASALALADQGAHLVLAARRDKELEDTAEACRAKSAEAVALPTDVAEEAQVQALARRAIATFGRIDVWFNNAGMDAFGRFEDIPPETFERVLQINLMGTVHGARAALNHFLERGSGILINNASLVGNCPSPFHSPYVASKFAIRGLSFALRQEVMHLRDVHVCVLSPASIDTPLWQRGANYSGRDQAARSSPSCGAGGQRSPQPDPLSAARGIRGCVGLDGQRAIRGATRHDRGLGCSLHTAQPVSG
jgi:NAD(P)-dependent dehydrogenase (short-subunit alcohol dehydrogenase family)